MKYYTVEEIAEMLKMNKFTVYKWVQNKQIKFIKIGSSVRISEDDLQEYLDKCKSE